LDQRLRLVGIALRERPAGDPKKSNDRRNEDEFSYHHGYILPRLKRQHLLSQLL
jgi:hypothetical protein